MPNKKMSSWKNFSLVYLFFLVITLIVTFYANGILNSSLKGYDDFIGDILNFSSILTGFLGVVIGILTAVSRNSFIMNAIMKREHLKKQLVVNIVIPFILGALNVAVSILYRLMLNNVVDVSILKIFNYLFIFTFLYFCVTIIMMATIVLTIFFKKVEKVKVIETE